MSHRFLFIKHGLVSNNAPGFNGVARFVPQLARLTLKFCKENGGSRGVRHFIENDIVAFARDNPHVAIYLKPRRNRGPVVVAEYLNGERHWQSLKNATHDDLRGWMDVLASASGREFQHQSKHHHTSYPSVQGMWNSYVNTDPAVTQHKFPSASLSRKTHAEKTATEKMLEIYRQQKEEEEEGSSRRSNQS